MDSNCRSVFNGNAATCATACAGYAINGAPNAADGNTVQCRIYHAGVAGISNSSAVTHCPHAAVDGGGVCIAAQATTGSTTGDANSIVAGFITLFALVVAAMML
jgi:hypothetical protein